MTSVVDASVTVAWCLKDESSPLADAVLAALIEDDAVVPAIWGFEVANALIAAEKRGRLTPHETPEVIAFLRSLPISIHDEDARSDMAALMETARANSLSAYDASYVHLALRSGFPLATLDARLRSACERAGVSLLIA